MEKRIGVQSSSAVKHSDSSEKSVIYTIDCHKNSIELEKHEVNQDADPRSRFFLQLDYPSKTRRVRTRHSIKKINPFHELERKLRSISRQGNLGSAEFYFGHKTDPFFPFDDKFHTSQQCLKLFQRFTPGMLTIQTRSPLAVIALSTLQKLGDHVSVTIAIETCDEDLLLRYSPELPKAKERFSAASALRNFGVQVNFQVAPLLPYGDLEQGALRFAELLVRFGDSIFVQPINDGSSAAGKRLRSSLIAETLMQDKRYEWLKPDCSEPLIRAIQQLAPDKLHAPVKMHTIDKQTGLFAA
jgi:DNA repair photolyase